MISFTNTWRLHICIHISRELFDSIMAKIATEIYWELYNFRPFQINAFFVGASRRVSSWCSRLDGKSPVIAFLRARNSDVKRVTGPGKEEDEEGRGGGEERGGIGKISKQISD